MRTAAVGVCFILCLASVEVQAGKDKNAKKPAQADGLQVYQVFEEDSNTFAKFCWMKQSGEIQKDQQYAFELRLDEYPEIQTSVVEYNEIRIGVGSSKNWPKVHDRLKPILKEFLKHKGAIHIAPAANASDDPCRST